MTASYKMIGISVAALGLALFTLADFEYPIAELGNCADKEACRVFCDDLANKDACVAFSERQGFVNQEDAARARRLPKEGPGGCSSESTCRAYCEDESHEDQCIEFGLKHGFITAEEAEQFKNSKNITGPGGCTSRKSCEAFCSDPTNAKECFHFAEKEGKISKKDLVNAELIISGGPGGCGSEESCRAFCSDASHAEECLAFGESNGLMSPEEAAQARKFLNQTGPGGCRGEACREFCNNNENREECFRFAKEHNLLPPEELERAEKFLRASAAGGPGGCNGEACRTYCEDSAHHDECFEFADKNGLLDEEERKDIQKFKTLSEQVKTSGGPGGCDNEASCRAYCSDPLHTEECLSFAVDKGAFSREEALEKLKEFKESESKFQAFGEGRIGEFRSLERMRPPFDAGKLREEFQIKHELFEQKRKEFEQVFREKAELGPEEFLRRREELEHSFQERNAEFEARRRQFEEQFRSEGRDVPRGFFQGGPPGEFPGGEHFDVQRQGSAGDGEGRIAPFLGNPQGFPDGESGKFPEGFSPDQFRPFSHPIAPEGQFTPRENFAPPSGSFIPPEGGTFPSGEFIAPQNVTPPPQFIPPSIDAEPPQQSSIFISPEMLLGTLFSIFLGR